MGFVCVYILKKNKKQKTKNSKKKIQDFQIFPKKKRKKFSKKKIFELAALDFLVTFSKRPIFFFQFQDS